jgi:alpha-N-arabinofuranosidase
VIATIPVKGITPDVIDDRYYKRGQGMFAEARHYDNTERNGSKIFVGEWATRAKARRLRTSALRSGTPRS